MKLPKPIILINPFGLDKPRSLRTNSRDYFQDYSHNISAGEPQPLDRLFDDPLSEKDWWSPWFSMLEIRKWVDEQGGSEAIVGRPNTSPYSNAQFELMAKDWAELLMRLLKRARKKWGQSIFPSGVMVRPLDSTELHYHLANQFPDFEHRNQWRQSPLVGWSESDVDILNEHMKFGSLPTRSKAGLEFTSDQKLMIISDHLTFVECSKRWQHKSPNPYIQFIPDLWYYRVVKTLTTIEEQPTIIYLFVNPEWGMEHLFRYGYFSEIDE